MSYTLVGGNFTRSYSSESLATYSVKLLASQQSHFKVDGVAFILLSPKGFLFVLQVDGTGSTPGRALFESFNFWWNRALEHSVELTDKSGLSGTFSLSQALAVHGHSFTTLDALHALVIAEPIPGPPRYWSVDNSEDITQLVRKTTHNHAHRSTYLAPPEEHLSVQTKRQTITHYNSYQNALLVDGLTVSALLLSGLYLENVSGTQYRLGVTSQRPVITLVNGNSISVEAGSVWSDPGSSAVDEDGTAVQVTITGDVINTSLLTGGTPYQLVYTAVSAAGDRNSVVRQVHVVDTTSPTIVLLAHSSGAIHPTLATGDAWVDPGYTATADGSWESVTHSQSGTVDVNTPGAYPLVVTATDGTNAATLTRTVTVQDPAFYTAGGPWTSCQWFSTGLGTALTSEVDQMSRGTNHGYQIKFSYKRSTDPQGVIFAITDSSFTDRRYEGPTSTAAVAFRIDATWGVMVRLAQSHSSWGSTRYIYEATGYGSWSSSAVYGHTQTNWNTITLRVYDKDSSNWGLCMFVNSASSGSQYIARTFAKGFPNGNQLSFPGRTSTWTGYSVNCVETGGAVTTSAGWRVDPGGEVKDVSISPLSPSANHTIP